MLRQLNCRLKSSHHVRETENVLHMHDYVRNLEISFVRARVRQKCRVQSSVQRTAGTQFTIARGVHVGL